MAYIEVKSVNTNACTKQIMNSNIEYIVEVMTKLNSAGFINIECKV